jgi:alkanesulfonate monooxygenase SsuD/methylene tetrahydromethanopterin reductase-like flavin-dependent oxidoreductase (luciferase family)
LIGGGGEKKTLKIVARHADIWHSFSDAATLRRKLGVLAEHCDAVGRDVSEIEISTEIRMRTEAEANEQVELGASMFSIGISGPDYGLAPVKKWLAWRDAING